MNNDNAWYDPSNDERLNSSQSELTDRQWLLIQQYADQSIDAAGFELLEELLQTDNRFRQRFVDYLALDSSLQVDSALAAANTTISSEVNLTDESLAPIAALVQDDAEFSKIRVLEKSSPKSSSRRSYYWLAANIALSIVSPLFLWLYSTSKSDSLDHDNSIVWAEILEINNLTTADNAIKWKKGDWVPLRDLMFSAGETDLRLDNGVTLSLEGPLHAEFNSGADMLLHYGRLSAEVGENAKGFTVRTATSEVVDLGTRFGVSASEAGDTDVVVFEGEVKVRRNNDYTADRAWTTLRSGEAIRAAKKNKELQRLARVRLSKNKKLWSSVSSGSGLVIDVTDNVTEPEFRHYLGVVPQGMGQGAQPFSDRPGAKWQAVPGESFPQELESADLVRTFLADRGDRELEISLQLSEPCIVYVFLDTRRLAPAWLEKAFIDTGKRIRVGPWPASGPVRGIEPRSDGKYFIDCAVWQCRYDKVGKLTLGSPFVKGTENQGLMYGVAVGPVPQSNVDLQRQYQ
ncbi:MAG: hypothetical protein RLY14_1240 [Planctomycetota bacterium]|jgi:hypothetical protein